MNNSVDSRFTVAMVERQNNYRTPIKTSTAEIHLDFFSATFMSLKRSVKNKHRLLAKDQADYFFESLFILCIQCALCIIFLVEEFDSQNVEYTNNFGLQLCSFFMALALHFSIISPIRNGVNMCHYVVYHHHEFDNPGYAFFLGFAVVFTMLLCQVTSIVNSLLMTSISRII